MSDVPKTSRAKAIRNKCLECSNEQQSEVRLCPCTACPLYPYRMGHVEREIDTAEENEPEEN